MKTVYIKRYRDRKQLWRWRAISSNGHIIADSGQGYTTWQSAWNGLKALVNANKLEIRR